MDAIWFHGNLKRIQKPTLIIINNAASIYFPLFGSIEQPMNN